MPTRNATTGLRGVDTQNLRFSTNTSFEGYTGHPLLGAAVRGCCMTPQRNGVREDATGELCLL